jgi:Fe2+ transport system protein B
MLLEHSYLKIAKLRTTQGVSEMAKKQPDSTGFVIAFVLCLFFSAILLYVLPVLSFIPIIGALYFFYSILSDYLIRKGRKHIEETYGKN